MFLLQVASAWGEDVRPQELFAPGQSPQVGDCATYNNNQFLWAPQCGSGQTSSIGCHTHPCVNRLCFNPRPCPSGMYMVGAGPNGDAICQPFATATVTATPSVTVTPTVTPTEHVETPLPTITDTPTATVTATPNACDALACETPTPQMTPEGAVVFVENGAPAGSDADLIYNPLTNQLSLNPDAGSDGGTLVVGDPAIVGGAFYVYADNNEISMQLWANGSNNFVEQRMCTDVGGAEPTWDFVRTRGTCAAPESVGDTDGIFHINGKAADRDGNLQTVLHMHLHVNAEPSPSYVPSEFDFDVGTSGGLLATVLRLLGVTHDVALPQKPNCSVLGTTTGGVIECKPTPTQSSTPTATATAIYTARPTIASPTPTPSPTLVPSASPTPQIYVPIVSNHVTIPEQSTANSFHFYNHVVASSSFDATERTVIALNGGAAGATGFWCKSVNGPGTGTRAKLSLRVNGVTSNLGCFLVNEDTSCQNNSIVDIADGDVVSFIGSNISPSTGFAQWDVTCGFVLSLAVPTPTATVTPTPTTTPTPTATTQETPFPVGQATADAGPPHKHPVAVPFIVGPATAVPSATSTPTTTPTGAGSPTATASVTPTIATATPTPSASPTPIHDVEGDAIVGGVQTVKQKLQIGVGSDADQTVTRMHVSNADDQSFAGSVRLQFNSVKINPMRASTATHYGEYIHVERVAGNAHTSGASAGIRVENYRFDNAGNTTDMQAGHFLSVLGGIFGPTNYARTTGNVYGLLMQAWSNTNATGTVAGTVIGGLFDARNITNGNINFVEGAKVFIGSAGTGTITTLRGLDVSSLGTADIGQGITAGTFTNATMVNVGAFPAAGPTYTNPPVGILLQQQTATNAMALKNDGATQNTPSSAQAFTAVGNTMGPIQSTIYQFTSNASYTLTSTPTIANGVDGQTVILLNVDSGADVITLQDQGTLASSNLRLGATTRALGPRDSITLVYSSTIGAWVEVAFSNVL